MKTTTMMILGACLFAASQTASAGCNAASTCSNMQVEQYRMVQGGMWAVMTDDSALSSISGCRIQNVSFGGTRPAIFLSTSWPTFDEFKEALLLSKMFEEKIGFNLFDNPDTTPSRCHFQTLTVEPTPDS